MIITITMSPTVDKSVTVGKLIPEKKMRCENLVTEAGGGGINVSKAIKKLGGESLAIFPSGLCNGKWLEENLSEQGINFKSIAVAKETRSNFTVTETDSNGQYRFVMPGPSLSKQEIKIITETILSLITTPAIIVASGSLPTGVPDDFFAGLASAARNTGSKFIIDTSGKPLQLAAQEGVYLLKPNLGELSSLAGVEHLKPAEVEDAARAIIQKGHCEIVVVSMGALGAMLVTQEICEMVAAPVVEKLSTIGAGDSMVAGIIWILEQKKSLSEMVRFGVACGTAATMNAGSQLFDVADVHKLYAQISAENGMPAEK